MEKFNTIVSLIMEILHQEVHVILTNHNLIRHQDTYPANKKYQSSSLSDRELQCLIHISEGMSMKQIAKKLHISDETVSSHTKAIRRKLGSKNIAQAVTKAYIHGFLPIKNT